MKKLYCKLGLLLALLLPLQYSWAQGVTTAAMSGMVTDNTGAGLPGATVVAIHTPTNTQYGSTTNVDGRYNIQNMRVGGPYTVRVTYIGFQEQTRTGINLSLSQNLRADFKLAQSEAALGEVEVLARRDNVINPNRNGAATNVRREQIERLPTINRSFQDFTRLTPQANGNSLMGRNGRFNNIQIDGANNSDLFGLGSSGAPGGQSGTTPISLDAIEEFQVVLSPYDVRQGRFSGGGINAVTRSGTNDFTGSAFVFGRNQNTAGKSPTPDPVTGERTKLAEFTDYQTGFRLGGPVIKDKLFFFVNGELTRRSEPLLFRAGAAGETGSDIVGFVTTEQLQQISQTLMDKYGYDAGTFGEINRKTQSNKAFARLDWNIDANHQLTLRHNFVDAYQDEMSRGQTEFRFGNNAHQQTNITNSTVAELKSRFGNKYANNLILGYSTIRDRREILGSLFPSVTIGIGGGSVIAGSQRSSVANRLSQDILEITDNFNIFAGKHTITLGTNNELFKFDNLFVNDANGRYDFPDLASFLAGNSTSSNYRYRQQYALPGGKPTAKFRAANFGVYAQDEYSITENFRVTGGIRLDMATYFDKPSYNYKVDSTFAAITPEENRRDVRTDRLPKRQIQFSPRLGFNWDVKNDKTTQVRGGIGIFTGRPAYVWISNQYGGTGVDFASYDRRGNENPRAPRLSTTVPDSIAALPAKAAKGSIAVTSKDFRNPQILRTNFAVDQQLPFGIVATVEGIFTKTLFDVRPIDINLREPVGIVQGDGRPIFPAGNNPATGSPARFYNSRDFNNVILLDNTTRGYQFSITGELKKQFSNGFFSNLAYTYGQSRDLYSGTSSTAVSTWEFIPSIESPNRLPLSYSDFDLRHRVIGSLSYRKEYANHLATTISLFYNGQSGNAFSYSYFGSDINNDGGNALSNSNDLIYIPRSQDEIVLVTAGTGDRRTTAEIWNDLNTFIENDEYLRENRGRYAERNGARTPGMHRIDMALLQDIYAKVGTKTHTIQLSATVTNIGNLFNSEWGRDYFVTNNNFGLLRFQGLEGSGVSGRPTFSFGESATSKPTQGYQVSQLASRWQAQFGIRYLF